jgi:hypothetical protein
MKNIQSNTFKLISLAIGLLATLMIFLPVLVFKDTSNTFTGLEIAFGKQFANLGPWASGDIKFNPVVLMAFLLPTVASLMIMNLKKGFLIASVLFMISTALILMIPQFTTVTITVLGNTNEIDVDWTYGIGLILAAILSASGALLSCYLIYKKI